MGKGGTGVGLPVSRIGGVRLWGSWRGWDVGQAWENQKRFWGRGVLKEDEREPADDYRVGLKDVRGSWMARRAERPGRKRGVKEQGRPRGREEG